METSKLNLQPISEHQKKDLLFASLDIPLPDKKLWVEKISQVGEEFWFEDAYHTNTVLPLRNQTGRYGFDNNMNTSSKNGYVWTPSVFPEVIDYMEKYVFPWSGDQCRISVLRTPPYGSSKLHIDCSPSNMGTIQHKFRLVLQGRTETLYFVTDKGNVFAPPTDKAFIMDGSWLHGMINEDPIVKYTLVLGAPWTSSDAYPPLGHFVSKSNLQMPQGFESYYDEKYFKSEKTPTL